MLYPVVETKSNIIAVWLIYCQEVIPVKYNYNYTQASTFYTEFLLPLR